MALTQSYENNLMKLTLSATDVLAPTTMKNAAKCDTSCELRNPVSHQNFERTLHFLRGVCLLECLFIPTSALAFCAGCCGFPGSRIAPRWTREASVFLRTHTTSPPQFPWCKGAMRRHDVSDGSKTPKLPAVSPSLIVFRTRALQGSKGGGSIRSDLQSVKNTRWI